MALWHPRTDGGSGGPRPDLTTPGAASLDQTKVGQSAPGETNGD